MTGSIPLNPDETPAAEVAAGTVVTPVTADPPVAGASDMFALRVLQAGSIAVILAASTYKVFELDRYFVPKDLALHLTALTATIALLPSLRRLRLTLVDLLLIGYLALSLLSAVFATNHWVAARALSLSASGIAVFMAARVLREAGVGRRLLGILAFAVVAGALAALLQTYGVRTDYFSLNRAPGGTLGNRNFVAHLAAFGLPLVLFAALRARDTHGFLLRAVAVTAVLATLVLTRSRAAWLAFAGVIFVFGMAMLISRALRNDRRTWSRLGALIVLGAIGVAAAVFTPNTLRWNSENPYLDSMKGVANYQEGSGHGRLIQYERSFRMAVAHPILGVGPGNWAVVYPKFAARRDPSMNRGEAGTTSNPWPSSDWVAFVSERGFAAAAMLLMALVIIGLQGLRRLYRAPDVDAGLENATLLATLAAVAVTGAFDAVLLLALPALLVWATLGALWWPSGTTSIGITTTTRKAVLAGVMGLSLLGIARSASLLGGMATYSTSKTSRLSMSARIDPGSYRAHMQLARAGSGLNRASRCRHAKAAHGLFPNAAAARELNRSCTRK